MKTFIKSRLRYFKNEDFNALTSAEKSKEKISVFATLGVVALFMIVSLSVMSLFYYYQWIMPMLIMVTVSALTEPIYKLIKKIVGCRTPKNTKFINLLSQASLLATLILALIFVMREKELKIFYALLFMCVPAFAYYFTNRSRQCTKAHAYIVFAFSLIMTFLGVGFPVSLMDNMSHWGVYATQYMDNAWFAIIIVPILFHIVSMLFIHFMPTDECAAAAALTYLAQHILHIFIYDLSPFQLNNIIFRIIWAVLFFFPWALFTKNHLGSSKEIIDCLKNARPAGGGGGGGYSGDCSGSGAGYNFNSSGNNGGSGDPYDAADANARSLGYNDASDAANQLGINENDLY